MSPPFASSEGVSASGDRYQSDGVWRTHPQPHSELSRCRERTCARLLALSHSPFAYFAYIFYFSLSIFTPIVILLLCDHRVRVFTAVRCGCGPITTHFGFLLPLPADAKMAADDQPKKSSKMVWRTCMLCSTRLSELCYDTHTKCEACRGQVCSDSFCVECEGWSADFRKLYLRRKHSLSNKYVTWTLT